MQVAGAANPQAVAQVAQRTGQFRALRLGVVAAGEGTQLQVVAALLDDIVKDRRLVGDCGGLGRRDRGCRTGQEALDRKSVV